jgi:hypothetical protein
LVDAIVAILAGELEGGWRIEWRRWFFLTLVKIHARRGLVPPISFEEQGMEAMCDGAAAGRSESMVRNR